jgi:CO/xanthine dehydrogenase FAD-binding subunit
MAVAHDFEYYCPTSFDEALKLIATHGDKAMLLAGGTDLAVYIKEGMVHPEAVIDLKHIKELKKLETQPDGLYIGALATFSDILAHKDLKKKYLPLWEAARSVASVGIRNRATLVGNICSAVPSLDSAPVLLCYDAVVHVCNQKGERKIPITEWFLAPRKTAKKPDEVVLGVTIPKPTGKNGGCYLKLGRYGGEDLAQAGIGILVNEKLDYKVAYCAVGPIPKRAASIEKLLKGKTLTPALIDKAKALVEGEIAPIADIRSSKEYRIHMCKVMLDRGLGASVDRLKGKTIETLRILGG